MAERDRSEPPNHVEGGRHRGGRSWRWLWTFDPRPLFLLVLLVGLSVTYGIALLLPDTESGHGSNPIGLLLVVGPFAIIGATIVWIRRRGRRAR